MDPATWIVLGVVALIAACADSDDRELPAWPGGDGEKDASTTGTDSGLVDTSTIAIDAAVREDVYIPSPPTDAGIVPNPDAAMFVDSGARTSTSSFSCKVVDKTRPSFQRGMKITNETLSGRLAPLTPRGNGFSVPMLFSSPNSDPLMVSARRQGRASSWPQDGQRIDPAYATLSASYQLGNDGSQLTIQGAQGGRSIMPMTPLDASGEPQSIDPTTRYEVYHQFSGPVSVPIQAGACPAGKFGGEASVTNSVNNAVRSLMMCCSQTQ